MLISIDKCFAADLVVTCLPAYIQSRSRGAPLAQNIALRQIQRVIVDDLVSFGNTDGLRFLKQFAASRLRSVSVSVSDRQI